LKEIHFNKKKSSLTKGGIAVSSRIVQKMSDEPFERWSYQGNAVKKPESRAMGDGSKCFARPASLKMRAELIFCLSGSHAAMAS
jgi:hypothetical protein